MHAAPLAAAGLLAHAVHLGLILAGTAGVVALLAPGWHASRVQRRTGTDVLTHGERMDTLRASVADPRPLPSRPAGEPR